jgi:hypothetical protein
VPQNLHSDLPVVSGDGGPDERSAEGGPSVVAAVVPLGFSSDGQDMTVGIDCRYRHVLNLAPGPHVADDD